MAVNAKRPSINPYHKASIQTDMVFDANNLLVKMVRVQFKVKGATEAFLNLFAVYNRRHFDLVQLNSKHIDFFIKSGRNSMELEELISSQFNFPITIKYESLQRIDTIDLTRAKL